MPNRKIFSIALILGIICLLTISCERSDSYSNYSKALHNQVIESVLVSGDNVWIASSDPIHESFIGYIPDYQISVLNLENYDFTINRTIPAIRKLTQDKSNNIYLATWDERILALKQDLSYDQYFEIQGTAIIESILFDYNNDLWVGTYRDGLYIYDGIDTTIFNTSNSILESNNVRSIVDDTESNIWIMFTNELFKINTDKTIEKDPALFPVTNQTGISNFTIDKNNSIWLTKYDGNNTLILNKAIDDQWQVIYPLQSASGGFIKFIKADSNGTIWTAYSGNLKDFLAYWDSGTWKEVSLPSDEIRIMDVDTYKNQLIIGTTQGIYITTYKN